jgi:membrane-associated phospholipid phosphatase
MIGPCFDEWNYHFFRQLFHLIPPTPRTNSFFEYLILNPLVSTWIFAFAFYHFWTREDDDQEKRRLVLTKVLIAVGLAIVVSILPRPWLHWPAPNSNPPYQQMFPRHLQGTGTRNCFPSHSTLVYLVVALGLWPIDRRWSVGLVLTTLACISLPRIYIGGHYAVDVVFSCLLAFLVFAIPWRWSLMDKASAWVLKQYERTSFASWIFLLWVFELGEEFRGSELLAGALYKFLRARMHL